MVFLLQLLGTFITLIGALIVGAVIFLPFVFLWIWGQSQKERNV